ARPAVLAAQSKAGEPDRGAAADLCLLRAANRGRAVARLRQALPGAGGARRGAARAVRADQPGWHAGRAAVRRRGAAAVDRVRAGARSRGSVPGRAHRRPRSAGPAQPVGSAPRDQRGRPDRRADDALHRRGRDPLRPRRDHRPRPHRRVRHPGEADPQGRGGGADHGGSRPAGSRAAAQALPRRGGDRGRDRAGHRQLRPGTGAGRTGRSSRAARPHDARRHAGRRVPRADRTGVPLVTSLLTLSVALMRGYLRDRAALFFTIVFPLIFLFLLGGLLGGAKNPRSNVVLVGPVAVYDGLPAHGKAKVDQVLAITRSHDLHAALADVRNGNEAAAVVQRGTGVVIYDSGASPSSAGAVSSVFQYLVDASNLAAAGQVPRVALSTSQVDDKSLKEIQYLTPGILGWAIATGATF